MYNNMEQLLAAYPKKRKNLPREYMDIYEQEYRINREGKSFVTYLSMKLENWLHYAILDKHKEYDGNILELGAGTLNHIPYEIPFSVEYDVVEPFTSLYKDSSYKKYVTNFFKSIYDIREGKQYSRIISKAVLEHVLDLPALVAYSTFLLKKDGIFQASIPSEGSLLWKLSYTMTTGIAYKLRTGLDYSILMQYEHVNTAKEIENIIRYFYRTVSCKRFFFPWFHGSIYSCLYALDPDLKKAKDYLQSLGWDKE